MKKNVLAFDPSTVDTGYAVMDGLEPNNIITYGSIKPTNTLAMGHKLNHYYKYVKDLIRAHDPMVIACEDQFSGKNSKTLMALREVTAVIRLVAYQEGVPFVLYANNTVKKLAAGDGRAGKEAVKDAVLKRFDISEDIRNDNITDAIAVGVTHLLS